MSDNGKSEEYVSRKDILFCAIKGEGGKIDYLFDFSNMTLIKAQAFDLQRIIQNISNQIDYEQAKAKESPIVKPPSMAESQRRFK